MNGHQLVDTGFGEHLSRLARRVGGGLVAIAVLLVLTQCDWGPDPAPEQSLVVEAFLETDRPLPSVTLRRTRPLNAPIDSLDDAASADSVGVAVGFRTVPYEEDDEQPGRYVPTNEIVVGAGLPWRLTVKRNGTTARAGGMTPPAITIDEVCIDVPETPARAVQVDSLRRDSLDIPADQGYLYPIEVAVRWGQRPPDADDGPYWVRAQFRPDASSFPSEVVDVFLQPAEVRREDQFAQIGRTRQWRGVYAVPVDSSDAPLPTHSLTTAVVRGDTSFASFAQTRTDPDRREPISNVSGALGVVLAVSTDSLTRVVEPGPERCRAAP